MLAFTALSGAVAAGAMVAFDRKERAHRTRLGHLERFVHVNGIRGKSTVTRMIGGMFRAAGNTGITKTTGTYACVIAPDATEHPIRRTGPANISEQYRFIRQWVGEDVDALVVECMAVKPKYQDICQNIILRAPLTVITNVRLDHQEDMGDTLPEIAASLCRTVPDHGVVVTGERDPELVAVIAEHCRARGSRLVVAEETELSRTLVDKFSYQQFEENVAVALAVAAELGIDRHDAVRGMLAAKPDPGTTTVTEVLADAAPAAPDAGATAAARPADGETGAGTAGESARQRLFWVPLFAVNDWESTVRVFSAVCESSLPEGCRKVVALNNRADRTDRAAMFVDVVAQELLGRIDRVLLNGDLQEVVRHNLIAAGVPEEMIVTTVDLGEEATGAELMDRARAGLGDKVAVFGMVNIHTRHAAALTAWVEDRKLAAGVGAAQNAADGHAGAAADEQADAVAAEAAQATPPAGVDGVDGLDGADAASASAAASPVRARAEVNA